MLLMTVTINGTDYRVSMLGASLQHWWPPYLIGIDPPKYQMREIWGGHVDLAFGSALFSPTLFVAHWPPPPTIDVHVEYLPSGSKDEADAVSFFNGTGVLTDHRKESVEYALYAVGKEANALTEGTDYDGNTVPLPRAFGTVAYVEPVRLADRNGHRCYDLGYLHGTVHTDWHVYDDGVDVCTNVTNVSGNTFEYTVTPVGTLTISGTGDVKTVEDVIGWLAAKIGLTANTTLGRSPSPQVSFWLTSQRPIIDVASDVTAFFSHLFYLTTTVDLTTATVVLVDMAADNGSRTITEWEYFEAPYGYRAPKAKITAPLIEREAGTWRAPGGGAAAVYVRETKTDVSVLSAYPFGEDMTLSDAYSQSRSGIEAALSSILTTIHSPVVKLSIPIKDVVLPGEKIIWTDESFAAPITLTIHARDISYDFDNDTMTIEGEGTVSA